MKNFTWIKETSVLQAPGYSNVIKRPMSFFQIHASLKDGLYASWEAVQRDLETMFNNAMVFNEPNTHYHQKVLHLYCMQTNSTMRVDINTPKEKKMGKQLNGFAEIVSSLSWQTLRIHQLLGGMCVRLSLHCQS